MLLLASAVNTLCLQAEQKSMTKILHTCKTALIKEGTSFTKHCARCIHIRGYCHWMVGDVLWEVQLLAEVFIISKWQLWLRIKPPDSKSTTLLEMPDYFCQCQESWTNLVPHPLSVFKWHYCCGSEGSDKSTFLTVALETFRGQTPGLP